MTLPSDLFTSARHLLLDHDFRNHRAWLVPMTREAYARAPFLDERIGEPVDSACAVPIARLHAAHRVWREDPETDHKPVRFIFHTAFCASTLLARCLDHPGSTLAAKEPLALHRVSGMQRDRLANPDVARAVPRERYRRLLTLTLDLLSRSFGDAEAPIVKATDSTNHIAGELLDHHDGSTAILLYSDLASFVLSCLKAEKRRGYVRRMLWRARTDAKRLGLFRGVRIPPDGALSDAEASAFVWGVQMYTYLDLLDSGRSDVRTLDASEFLGEPGETLAAAADHLALPLDEGDIAAARDTTMTRHAKRTESSFSPEAAARERASLEAAFASELGEAEAFLDSLTRERPIVLPLASALLR